jgi:tyrosinase
MVGEGSWLSQKERILLNVFCRLQSSTYQLLASQTNYTVFSTDSLENEPPNYNNLESIHNTIHGLVGNGGHMSYLDVAAFDPIFWLHHW